MKSMSEEKMVWAGVLNERWMVVLMELGAAGRVEDSTPGKRPIISQAVRKPFDKTSKVIRSPPERLLFTWTHCIATRVVSVVNT